MTPADHDIVEAAVGLVHTVLGRVNRVVEIRVGAKSVRVDNLLGRNLAAHHISVSNYILQKSKLRSIVMQ